MESLAGRKLAKSELRPLIQLAAASKSTRPARDLIASIYYSTLRVKNQVLPLLFGFVSRLAQELKHAVFVSLYARLIEWIHAQRKAAQGTGHFEEVNQST